MTLSISRLAPIASFVLAALATTLPTAQAAPPASAPSPTLTAPQQQRWDDARQAFREGRYAAAYGRFATLADAGHVPAAQMALAMLRQGEPLFGSAFTASVPQQRRWTVLTVNDSRQHWRIEGADAE